MCRRLGPRTHIFFTEVRYKGTKTVAITPDYSEVAKLSDIWLNPRQGTDAAMAMAMGHVILTEYHTKSQSEYFDDYTRLYSDMPFLVQIDEQDGIYVAGRTLRAADFDDNLGQDNNPDWKSTVIDANTDQVVTPNGTVGSRWGEDGHWNLESKNLKDGTEIWPLKSLVKKHDEVLSVGFPYFGNLKHEQPIFKATDHDSVLFHNIPVRKIKTRDGDKYVATVFDLMLANYGVDSGLGGDNVATSYDDDKPYTPAWQERITGVSRDKVIKVAREFADNADKTRGAVHDHHRGRHESLVSHGYELPWGDQYAGDVWLYR